MDMPIIKYEPVLVDTRRHLQITVYRGNYKVEGLYVTDDFGKQAKYKNVAYRDQSVFFPSYDLIDQGKVFFTIEDAGKEKAF